MTGIGRRGSGHVGFFFLFQSRHDGRFHDTSKFCKLVQELTKTTGLNKQLATIRSKFGLASNVSKPLLAAHYWAFLAQEINKPGASHSEMLWLLNHVLRAVLAVPTGEQKVANAAKFRWQPVVTGPDYWVFWE